jgi:hypothetical protein
LNPVFLLFDRTSDGPCTSRDFARVSLRAARCFFSDHKAATCGTLFARVFPKCVTKQGKFEGRHFYVCMPSPWPEVLSLKNDKSHQVQAHQLRAY